MKKKSKKQDAKRTRGPTGFPVVGIGASAGGLEALSELLKHMPSNTGMAFVVVQHLDPKHESLSAEILSRVTEMPVHEVKDGVQVEANRVYVIPPNTRMAIMNGILSLLPRDETRVQHMVIDFFFQSLALDEKRKAIGVVLSGTASDGTQGLMAIKAEGGFTCAQEPSSAKFDGMPRNAIASGMVDLVLTPKGLAKELARIAKHPYVVVNDKFSEASDESLLNDKSLRKIFVLLRSQTHVDFSSYKYTTIMRRIARRIVVCKVDSLASYADYLQAHPDEVLILFNDILINVTCFFRDADVFKELRVSMFPKLTKNKPIDTPIRVWVPGCSTGEEAYSLAIALSEYLTEKNLSFPIQIFATDISETAIQKARVGFYSEALTCQISKARLGRFFERCEGGHKVKKLIRDMCLFSRHDVTSDPPFAKLDLISCRNLLIYFSPELQKRVIPIFHYSLKPKGFLLLGRSEGTAGFSNLFDLENKLSKIFSKNNSVRSSPVHFPLSTYVAEALPFDAKSKPLSKVGSDFQKDADQIVMDKYSPPGAVLDSNLEVIQFRGRIGPFLDPSPGQPSLNLLKLAHTELLPSLRMAIQSAKKKNAVSTENGLDFELDGQQRTVTIKVVPTNPQAPAVNRKYLVLFESVSSKDESEPSSLKKGTTAKSKKSSGKKDSTAQLKRIERLERELVSSREHQESLAEEYDTTQEELTSANEELQSTNEEFQSTNEELETAKEELQSANEELTTVNDELQNRNLDLTNSNNDLTNLLGAVEIPIVMVGSDHRIRRFTPKAAAVLNLISTDVGRPINDIRPNFDLDIDGLISEVIETLTLKEIEIKDRSGRWSRVQIRPYKTVDSKIDGAVLSFTDIDDLKKNLKEVQEARTDAEQANRAKDLFLATLSHELRTPLTAILSWGQLLESGKLDKEKTAEASKRIVESAQSQKQLISDLLDVSRIVMGKIALELCEVDPTEILHSAIDAVRPTAQSKEIIIESSLGINVGKIMADPVRIKQVFWNLLTNAVKFSSPKSKVVVNLTRVQERDTERAKVMIKVIDSGKGIKPDFLPNIFDSFSQEDNSSIRKHGGLGLGLAIVKNLVELQGGTVEAESSGEKMGAVFTVNLPLLLDREISNRPTLEVNSDKLSSHKKKKISFDGLRILLVDDEDNAREATSEILRSRGADIKTANSAREAIKVFAKFKPDIVVSDIAMPGEDGYALIKKIRAFTKKEGGLVPAIAMTAYASTDDVERALSAGFQVHLAKPFDATQFVELIAKIVGR